MKQKCICLDIHIFKYVYIKGGAWLSEYVNANGWYVTDAVDTKGLPKVTLLMPRI